MSYTFNRSRYEKNKQSHYDYGLVLRYEAATKVKKCIDNNKNEFIVDCGLEDLIRGELFDYFKRIASDNNYELLISDSGMVDGWVSVHDFLAELRYFKEVTHFKFVRMGG